MNTAQFAKSARKRGRVGNAAAVSYAAGPAKVSEIEGILTLARMAAMHLLHCTIDRNRLDTDWEDQLRKLANGLLHGTLQSAKAEI